MIFYVEIVLNTVKRDMRAIMKNIKIKGFTLIELMIVIAIIGILSMISIPSLVKFLSKSKRAEAYVNLGSLAMAQKAYWAENGTYTTKLAGPDSANWKPQVNHNYTYGFSGSEGTNNFVGKLKSPADFSESKADETGFTAYAIGDIDGDGQPDILSVDQDSNIKIVQDDLN